MDNILKFINSPNDRHPLTVSIAYFFPRVIATVLSTISTTYLGDIYIKSYKWSQEDFSTLSSIYIITLIICYALFSKIANDNLFDDKKHKEQLQKSKTIAIIASSTHFVSFVFLLFLPSRWVDGTLDSDKKPKVAPVDSNVSLRSGSGYELPSVMSKEAITGLISKVTGSRLFIIHFFVIIYAASYAAFELYNRALPTFIYGDDDKNKELRTMNGINVYSYGFGMLLIHLIISVPKGMGIDSDIIDYFFLPIILLTVFQIASLTTFSNSLEPELYFDKPCTQPNCEVLARYSLPFTFDWCKLICVIIFRATVSFWIITSVPLIQHLSTDVLGGNDRFGIFGTSALTGGFSCIAIGYAIYNQFYSDSHPINDLNIFTNSQPEGTMTTISILGQFSIYFLFIPFDYSWNVGNWLNILLLIVCGAAHGLFLIDINYMIDKLIIKKYLACDKWAFIGRFLSISTLIATIASHFLYQFYNTVVTSDKTSSHFSHDSFFSFTNIYILISVCFHALNVIAARFYFNEDLKETINSVINIVTNIRESGPLQSAGKKESRRTYKPLYFPLEESPKNPHPEMPPCPACIANPIQYEETGQFEKPFQPAQPLEPIQYVQQVNANKLTPLIPDEKQSKVTEIRSNITQKQRDLIIIVQRAIDDFDINEFVKFNQAIESPYSLLMDIWKDDNRLKTKLPEDMKYLSPTEVDIKKSFKFMAVEAVSHFKKSIEELNKYKYEDAAKQLLIALKRVLLLNRSQLEDIRIVFSEIKGQVDFLIALANYLPKELKDDFDDKSKNSDIEYCKILLRNLLKSDKNCP